MTEFFQGGVNVVRRNGAVVHRPATPASPAIHRLLRHLHHHGFRGAPQPLGFDTDGEILTFLEGDVPERLTPDLRTDALLTSAATLLRRFHDATTGFEPHSDDRWWCPPREPVEVMCHGDIAQYNSVVQDGRVVGFIDFDATHPGPRVWDIAYAVYRFAPLQAPTNPESFGTVAEQASRVLAFCRAYGPAAGPDVIDVVPERLQLLIDFMHAQASAGNVAFQQHIASGHAALYEDDIRYVLTNRDAFRSAF